MESLEDDWMFESIKKYKTLLMFDLHNAATSLTWITDKTVCVSTEGKDKHEILELSLPEKILSSADSEGLCSDRDFRVLSGGFTEDVVKEIKHIPDTRSIAVTQKGDNSLTILKLGSSNSDLIEKVSSVTSPIDYSEPVTLDVSHHQAVFGSNVTDICIADIDSNKVVQTADGERDPQNSLNKLFLAKENIVLACCQQKCQIWRFDLREGLKKGEYIQLREANQEENCDYWTYDVENANEKGREIGQVISLGSNGLIVEADLRNSISVPTTIELGGIGKSAQSSPEYLTVQMSPSNSDVFSVSGLGQLIHVNNFKKQENGCINQSDFCHEGHAACSDQSETLYVTSHLWHPWQPNLILSSASNGSLHAWQREVN